MFNNVEQKTISILKEQHGSVHDMVEPLVKELGLATANEYLKTAYEMYLENPSSTNYNYMISTMLVYQYWNQKETNEFSITEEF